MQKNTPFSIKADRSGNKVSVNGQGIATCAPLDAGASLKFELDLRWTLAELGIRAATLEHASERATARR
jgi:hypothetical protein